MSKPRPETDTATMDASIAELRANADRWAKLPLSRKIALAEACLRGTAQVSDRQVAAAVEAKRIPMDDPRVGEEYLGGPVVTLRNLRLLIQSLKDVDRFGAPRLKSGAVTARPSGQVVVEVFPVTTLDKLLYAGFSAQVWMDPSVQASQLRQNMAEFYRRSNPEGKVALVLGAGNVASIGPLDVIYKLFVEGQVCLLKMNPVNDYLGPYIEEAFAALIREGYLRMAYGGAGVGAYLCSHADIDEIHITGSDKTHDAIVYGVGEEGAKRKAENQPVNDKRITSELGNVSPVIVVPGKWTDAELRYQAENVATQMTNNGGFNCNAAKVLVTHRGWPQREAFLQALRDTLSGLSLRYPYYPGARERYEQFMASSETAQRLGQPRAGDDPEQYVPWGLITDIDPEQHDHLCFTQESFCAVTAETSLPGNGAADFLKNATAFCNDVLWGTLNAGIIVDPRTERELGAALDQTVADLRYGSVTINHWAALSYGLGSTTWGAYPGHTVDDIRSGVGVVHNTFLFDKPQKSVVRGPFQGKPKPPWFVTHRMMRDVARKMVAFEASPSYWKLPSVIVSAIRA